METTPDTNVIEVLSLTRRYGSLVAVDHLTFSVASGATFGLLGPNGAGKSTLIKMLTTLLPPTEGTAKIAGFDLVQASRSRCERRSGTSRRCCPRTAI